MTGAAGCFTASSKLAQHERNQARRSSIVSLIYIHEIRAERGMYTINRCQYLLYALHETARRRTER